MKKLNKKILVFISIMAMFFSFSMSAFAMETPTEENTNEITVENAISPRGNIYESSGVTIYSTKWTTVARSTTGFNRNVKISVTNAAIPATTSIRMLGKNGNVVWEEYKAISFSGSRIFWCGSDVYTVQARVNNGMGTAVSWPA